MRSFHAYCDFPQPLPWPILFKLLTPSLCSEKVIIMMICILIMIRFMVTLFNEIVLLMMTNKIYEMEILSYNTYLPHSF